MPSRPQTCSRVPSAKRSNFFHCPLMANNGDKIHMFLVETEIPAEVHRPKEVLHSNKMVNHG